MSVTESRPFATNNFKYKYARNLAFGSFAVFLLGGALMLQPFSIADNSYADSKNTAISLKIGESIMVPEVSTDSINIELDPTAADGDFKTASVTVGVSTNRTAGYTLTASVEGDETALTNADYDNYEIAALGGKTAAATFADLDDSGSMNKWGYATDNNGDGDGQTEAGYYYAMPGKDSPTTLKITDGPAATSNTEVTFATKGKDLAAGKYENTVVFTAVGNLEIPCSNGCTIHYDSNGADGGVMTDQTTIDGTNDGFSTAIDGTNYTDVTLRAQNFWRSGYGFAGWNTKADGSGTTYGPMETVDLSELINNNEVTLYAKWVASAGNIQDFTASSCSSMSTGDVTARKDSRNGMTYAIAKLADGKCWMIENLRLGSASDLSITTSNSVTAGTIPASSSSWHIGSSAYATMQQNYSNINTSLTASPNDGGYWYGYGNYYSWAQAIMDTTSYSISGRNVSTSLCPKNWHLPTGGSSGEFYTLNTAVNGDFTSVSTGLRAYPVNFVYSGYWGSVLASYRGTTGYYWSSTVYNSSSAYRLTFYSTITYPGTVNDPKYSGFAVRCLIGG